METAAYAKGPTIPPGELNQTSPGSAARGRNLSRISFVPGKINHDGGKFGVFFTA
jgi:hypothetical protein